MNTYEYLLSEAETNGVIVKELPLVGYDGRIKGNRIAVSQNLTLKEKSGILAEELGHYYTGYGNILDQSSVSNRKQELHGRMYAYNRLVGLMGIIDAYKHNCTNMTESAEYLDVSEEFLKEALIYYKAKYGTSVNVNNYVIFFEPSIGVLELI